MIAAMLLERGLNSGPISTPLFDDQRTRILRNITVSLGAASLLADISAIYWFARMKRKFRHTLIATLLFADLLKDINYVAFGARALSVRAISSSGRWCQTSGFFLEYFTEVTDFAILAIVAHMSMQILVKKKDPTAQGGLHPYRFGVFAVIFGLPLIMSCIAFINPSGGYAVVGGLCNLPIRPFWYRLALAWIPRYIIAITIVTLTIIIRIRVGNMQKKLAELQAQLPPQISYAQQIIEEAEETDEAEVSENRSNADATPLTQEKPTTESFNSELEKQELDVAERDLPPMPTDQEPFSATDCRKFKRMSYRQRPRLSHIATSGLDQMPSRQSIYAPSLAPSSAVLAPHRDSTAGKRESIMTDHPVNLRRSSLADFASHRTLSVVDAPQRRKSLVDMTSASRPASARASRPPSLAVPPLPTAHSADRVPTLSHRRSSIWDEIDASLEKKVTNNRVSIFTVNAPETNFNVVTYSTDADAIREETPRHSTTRSIHPERPKSAMANRISSSSPVRESFISTANNPNHPNDPNSRHSHRQSKVYEMTRRAMSVISVRGTGAQSPEDNSPEAILRRRHRYIERQLRYLTFYPLVYLLLWACPFALHVLQYQDRFASSPPFWIVVLTIVSLTAFGAVNSVVFCLREKPWAVIDGADGTWRGGVRADPVWTVIGDCWARSRGRDRRLDFAG